MENYSLKSKATARHTVKASPLSFWYMPIATLFSELMAHLFLFGFTFDRSLLLIPLFAVTVGLLFTFFAGCFRKPVARFTFCVICLAMQAVFFCVHIVYCTIFDSAFSWQTLGLAGDAMKDFIPQTLKGIWNSIIPILVMFLPLVFFCLAGKKRFRLPRRFDFLHVLSVLTAAVVGLVSVLSVAAFPANRTVAVNTGRDTKLAIQYFGIVPATLIDITQSIFGAPDEDVDNPYDDPQDDPEESSTPEEVLPTYNELPIDFDKLIANTKNKNLKDMHKYFASVPPTNKNEYTGMFKGKNLIFLCIEGFSDRMIDPELTPTLYKMRNEGFRFENFYAPMWGGSTATGEYACMTGNFYNTAVCLKASAKTNQYSAMGNLFKSAGYNTYAYHNNTYQYYSRNLSHPNFGYNYKGIGNGLVVPFNGWPRSDAEMGEASIDDYINSDKPFHTYYMTVSGHANYTWMGNSMSWKNRSRLGGSPYSENVKAYIACELEVEDMLTVLCNKLEAAGKLEDTVFAMCCDHYPYALSDKELAELYDLPENGIHNNYELYHNSFILWSASMKAPVTVDTPCASYDMVPTLANLFGLDYDSRLITGKDILSDTENIVVINTLSSGGSWNWITAEGKYSTVSGRFTPSETCTMTEEEQKAYVEKTNRKVTAMKTYSFAILDKNYYATVFDKDFNLLCPLEDGTADSGEGDGDTDLPE